MVIFIIWVGLAFVISNIASKQRKDALGAFLISLLLTPLIGLLYVLASSEIKRGDITNTAAYKLGRFVTSLKTDNKTELSKVDINEKQESIVFICPYCSKTSDIRGDTSLITCPCCNRLVYDDRKRPDDKENTKNYDAAITKICFGMIAIGIVVIIINNIISSDDSNSSSQYAVNSDSINHVVPFIEDSLKATRKVADQDTSNISKPPKAPKYKILRSYQVLHIINQYDILINPVNLNAIIYKKDVEAILDDMAKKLGTTEFYANIYDNPKAAELNYNDLELGKHLSKSETKLVNYHIVANYDNTAGYFGIGYFINIAAENRGGCIAWKEAFNENDFNNGYKPRL